jgi:hypothetical protein
MGKCRQRPPKAIPPFQLIIFESKKNDLILISCSTVLTRSQWYPRRFLWVVVRGWEHIERNETVQYIASSLSER